jgi:ABC-type Zn uptake system ZnuABC Zn-binding protein ZnuA
MSVRKGVLALAVGALAGVLSVAGCGSGPMAATTAPSDGQRLGVVATTTQLGDFARNLGGEKVTVTQILQANVDPHDYEPTPADIAAIGKAKVLLRNGIGLDRWLDDTVTASGYAGPVIDTSKGVAIHPGKGDEQEKDGDPHIWQNPLNAKIMSANVTAALVAADPGNAAHYQQNLTAYQAKLDALDADIKAKIDSIPAGQRKLVTNHDAFGYYIERYQLEFVGSIIPSFDTSAELSGAQIQDLVAKIKATGAKAIFSESSLPPKTAQTIASETGVHVEAGEDSLYADTLGPAGSAGATYLGALTHNTDVIVRALRGSA